MGSHFYGYGRMLEVDLATKKVRVEPTDPSLILNFIGGMGFSNKILYDEVGPDIDPLGPLNPLIVAAGPLNGTKAPCSGRIELTAKSPLTGLIGSSNTGGMWGAMLKRAGYDIVIVRSVSEQPVYLCINDDSVEIRDASHLWGKDTWETTDILKSELHSAPPKFVVMAIGPAGENLVRYSCPINEYYHAAGRTGLGAVMGAKKLKAIAVRGTGRVSIARPDEFEAAAQEARRLIMNHPRYDEWRRYGSFPVVAFWPDMDCLPGKNFQTGILPDFARTRGMEALLKYTIRPKGSCYGCPMACFNMVEVNEGKYAGLKVSSVTFVSSVLEFGGKCAIDNLPAIWYCKELTHRLGMDYGSASGSIALAMELYQRGIITREEADHLDLTWGNEDAVIQMLQKIAYRQGFGDLFADGNDIAAQRIGKGATDYVMTIKGMDMMWSDPRSCTRAWSFSSLTSPRGGDNVKTNHSLRGDMPDKKWPIEKWDMDPDVKRKGYGMTRTPDPMSLEGKAVINKWFEDVTTVTNLLGVCFFPTISLLAVGPTQWAKLLSACTSRDISGDELMAVGDKVFNLQRTYLARAGITRKDDDWPERFYREALPEGSAKGAQLSRDMTNKFLDEYYEVRGWDKTTGNPTRNKLLAIGLRDIVDDLSRLSKL